MLKKKNTNGKMTLEKLSRMVANGFATAASKQGLKELEKGVNAIDINIEGIKHQTLGINNRIDYVYLNKVSYDSSILEHRVSALERA